MAVQRTEPGDLFFGQLDSEGITLWYTPNPFKALAETTSDPASSTIARNLNSISAARNVAWSDDGQCDAGSPSGQYTNSPRHEESTGPLKQVIIDCLADISG